MSWMSGFFLMINHINMHLFLGICTTLVLNLGFVELEDSDILGSEYQHRFIVWRRMNTLQIDRLNGAMI